MNKDAFSRLHPIINFVYFALVIGCAMILTHPVCLALSFVCALTYSICLKGKKAVRFNLLYMLPLLIMTMLINPAFSHQGVTILAYLPSGNPLTLESILYGISSAFLLITVIAWFSCFNAVITSDKLVYLFGRIIPALSLILSISLRFVPRFTAQIKVISNAQKCVGRDISNGGLLKRAKHGIKILSVLVTWALENAIVTDKVWHELAFGLESLAFDTPTIRLRVAEMASFFGIQTWFYKNVTELSGGQKQLLALASVMALQPSVLILDEPTSQLDPIAAADFLAIVGKINRELGVTVILTEHRLEEAFPLASRAVVMDGGKIITQGSPAEVGEALRFAGHKMFHAMPVPMRVWAGISQLTNGRAEHLPCPVTVRDGREWLSQLAMDNGQLIISEMESKAHSGDPAIELEEVWFKYAKDAPDVVKGVSFKAYPGELTAILGGNGTGKTTTLTLIAGLNKPYSGKVKINGEALDKIPGEKLFDSLLGVLPQNPQSLFTAKTVREDLLEILSDRKLSKTEKQGKLRNVAALCHLENLLDSHPYDLSGGEQQWAALAKVLLLEPRILLLDEPTKGLDAEFKTVFALILRNLTTAGVAVVMVSHDLEFCAEYADRCALFFDGNIVTENVTRTFFSGNSFYTSAANRMARHILPQAVTAEDIIRALGGTPQLIMDIGQWTMEDDDGGVYALKEDKNIIEPKPEAKSSLYPGLAHFARRG
ncbi:MAG: ATP-binding cassette domain-containing protein [Oscillospiraceae bacterium]|jgi:energy-coupling factor transporter ATP-binding protein EcfA2|nr:ATP-binding cassette domain-containing protein [Oscillospiraceae bacterium]